MTRPEKKGRDSNKELCPAPSQPCLMPAPAQMGSIYPSETLPGEPGSKALLAEGTHSSEQLLEAFTQPALTCDGSLHLNHRLLVPEDGGAVVDDLERGVLLQAPFLHQVAPEDVEPGLPILKDLLEAEALRGGERHRCGGKGRRQQRGLVSLHQPAPFLTPTKAPSTALLTAPFMPGNDSDPVLLVTSGTSAREEPPQT